MFHRRFAIVALAVPSGALAGFGCSSFVGEDGNDAAPADDTSSDARVDASSDGPTIDAADAADAGFCARATTDATTFCDDFTDPSFAARWTGPDEVAGSVSTTDVDPFSPPASMLATLDGGANTESARIFRPLAAPPNTSVRFSMRMRVDSLPAGGNVLTFLALRFGKAVSFFARDASRVYAFENANAPDGGGVVSVNRDWPLPVVENGKWASFIIEVRFTRDAGVPTATHVRLVYNGTEVANEPFAFLHTDPEAPRLELGLLSTGGGVARFAFDDVLVERLKL